MVMRYAHLSPAYLSAEVGLLDAARATAEYQKGNVPRSPHDRERKSWNL